MGLSSMGSGGGGGNSSTSNLSASAPPFTVDRLNPKPNSNPLLHYSDSPYVVDPFSHSSQYAHLSAPRVEPAIDSNEIISVPVSDGYRFSASASASPSSTQWSAHNSAYGGDVKPPYYNPYVPPLVGEDSLLAEGEGSHYNVALTSGLGVTSQHDYTRSLFDLEYGPRWVDSLGLDDGKRAKRSEFDGNFSSEKQYVGGSHGYENQPYRGMPFYLIQNVASMMKCVLALFTIIKMSEFRYILAGDNLESTPNMIYGCNLEALLSVRSEVPYCVN